MKKSIFYWMLLLGIAFSSPSCVPDDDGWFGNCQQGEGPEVERVLDMPDFTGVKLSCEAKVFITQGDVFEVVAVGEENVIEELELDVRDDTWDIEFDDCMKDYDLEIYITMPTIEYLGVSGSGEIRGDNFFTVQDIVLRVSGSGGICLGLYAEEMDGKISGSGEVELEGEAERLDFDISGSGDLKAFNMPVEKADIAISGSGDASVQVLEVLDVRISGSGNVYYKGYPVINSNISGSGDVVDSN
ncbi:MAG: DUF2807 domain-containing protein [Saprospiraceae bacterium]|nr:DUF2807 domain-containing protein [Saprospiraceae bacterium]